MSSLQSMLPIIIPLAVTEVILTGAALFHILTHKNYKRGNRILWVILSFINIIGPVVYFILGRSDE